MTPLIGLPVSDPGALAFGLAERDGPASSLTFVSPLPLAPCRLVHTKSIHSRLSAKRRCLVSRGRDDSVRSELRSITGAVLSV